MNSSTSAGSDLLSPLGDQTYRRMFCAQVLSLAGTGLMTVALALLAYDLAGQDAGEVLGTALAIKMIAYVGIAPLVGAAAHRLPRRAFLVALDILRAGVALALPFVDAVWQVYLLIFLLQAGSAAFTPTFQATIPDVLSDERRYTSALSLSRLAYDLEALLSPTLAAALLLLMSFHWLFAGTALGFLLSAALVLSVALPSARAVERVGGVGARIAYGLALYLKTPRLRGLLALNLAVAAAGAMVIVNTVVVVRWSMGGDEADVALLLVAAGAGSMAAAMLLPRLLDRVSDRRLMMTGAVALVAGLYGALLLPSSFTATAALWCLLGAGSSMVQTPAGRLLRRSAQAEDRPAAFAAQFALSHACWLITYPAAGWIGARAGLDAAFLTMGFLAAVGLVVATVVWRVDDPVDIEHVHEEVRHEHTHVHDEHHQHAHKGWEGEEPHRHAHTHNRLVHRHAFFIDLHHRSWPA